MEYKLMSEMIKQEVEYILKEICGLEYNSIDSIEYNNEENSINVIVLETWVTKDDDGIEREYEDTEDVILSDVTIDFEHGQMSESIHEYKKYIVAKGYYYLWRDNKYY